MIRPEEIRALSIPSSFNSLVAVVSDWLLVAAAFALTIYFPHPAVFVTCFLFMARQQLAFAILMHDASHRRLMKSTVWNDYIGQFLCAGPLFFSMYSYQKLHLKHHREPLAPDDPDLSLTGGYPIPWISLMRKLLRDASGLSYIKFIRYFIYMARKPKAANVEGAAAARGTTAQREVGPPELKSQGSGGRISMSMIVVSMLLPNFLMWSILFLAGHGWYYLFFWVLPAVTFLQVLLRIRGITEHAGYQPNADQRLNARTVLNPVQTFIFAPHNVNYHIEHHVYPAVPFHNLPKLHRLMMELNLIPPANLYRGYGQVLRELTKVNVKSPAQQP
jgi:fatty acid desaturase